MKRKRDFQRSRVYASEREHSLHKEAKQEWRFSGSGRPRCITHNEFTDGTRIMSYAEVKEYVEKIMRSRWWKSKFPPQMAPHHLRLKDGRGTSWARGHRTGASVVLNIPKWARFPLVILHELAHVMTPSEYVASSHGRRYCKNYLALIKRWLGHDAWVEMKGLFKEYKVKTR